MAGYGRWTASVCVWLPQVLAQVLGAAAGVDVRKTMLTMTVETARGRTWQDERPRHGNHRLN